MVTGPVSVGSTYWTVTWPEAFAALVGSIGTVTERSWTYGRDYSFALSYTQEF